AADSDMSFVLSDADRRLGLKTSVALQRLAEEVDAVRRSSFRRWRFDLACLWRHPPITLPHIGVNLALWALLLAASALADRPEDFLPVVTMALVLTAMLLLIGANVAAAVLIDWLSHNGVDKKIQNLCADLAEYSRTVNWPVESAYPDLSAPSVSTIHCHWTLRDGHLINLPAMLLVRDDIIYVRPGIAFNVHCCELPQQQQSEQLARSFEPDDRYMPVLPDPARRSLSRPVSHRVLPPLRCRVKLTPAVDFVRDFLNLHIRGRSDLDALFARGCRACLVCVGVAFAVCLVAALAKRHVIGEDSVSAAYALAFPCLATLPILLLSCPPMWHALNLWELAKALVHVHRTSLASDELLRQPDRPPSMDSLTESIGSLSDLDTCDTTAAASIVAGWRDALAKLMYLLTDNAEVDWKLVHSFGTMSRLCCADKEGILSLPIPLPDKVCFLRRKHRHRSTPAQRKKSDMSLQTSEANSALLDTEAHIHVLDVSHDPKIAYRLDFDDPHWRRFLKSLKPLGLAILLNNCHPSARPSYDAFAHHVTAVTLPDDPRACVNKRRCLCDLARLIGFKDAARDPFSLQFTLGTYQQASKEDQGKDQFLRLLSALRQKAPVGHTFGCAVQQRHLGGQYFVQGSADVLVSELCADYWNGNSVSALTELDRKRLLNFYSRHSYSSYCDAFAYTPVLNKMSPAGGSGDRCVELPPFRLSSEEAEDPPTPMLLNTPLSRTFSAETTLHRSSNLSLTDVDTCLSMQSGQVFLGMVASQFQANSDVVRLIDQLELGCIRFVYFSEENELRSRGFAERLGLESGWNCHISLRSDSCGGSRATVTADREPVPAGLTTTMSGATLANLSQWGSAPALINTDTSRVTFKGEPDELVFTAETPGGDGGSADSSGGSESDSDDVDAEATGVRSGLSSRDDAQSGCSTASGQRADASREESELLYVDQNKSRLPRGIAEIRPHLQKVDNVPLQVSLFTDCDIGAVSEMLLIMRQYGERSVLLYSALSLRSCRLAKITDTAIALVPQLPPTCRSEPAPPVGSRLEPSPAFVAAKLLSLPAGYAPTRLAIAGLIADCRCSVERLKRPLRAFLSMALMLSALHAVCGLLMLPPCLSAGQTAALSFVLLPAAAFGTVAKSEDRLKALNQPARRRDLPRRKALTARYLSLHLALTLPSAVVAALVFVAFVYTRCSQLAAGDAALLGNQSAAPDSTGNWSASVPIESAISYYQYHSLSMENVTACLGHSLWTQQRDNEQLLAAFQGVLFCFIVLACLITSLVFVTENLRPFRLPIGGFSRLKVWAVCQFATLAVGLSIAALDMSMRSAWSRLPELGLHVWLPLILWLLALGPVNEIVKHRQMRIKSKEDRAARLHFDTKLGMYSPV
ncbi:hypothetical protein BOX15_Mlig031032g1, partial [Macrostomum lignano]